MKASVFNLGLMVISCMVVASQMSCSQAPIPHTNETIPLQGGPFQNILESSFQTGELVFAEIRHARDFKIVVSLLNQATAPHRLDSSLVKSLYLSGKAVDPSDIRSQIEPAEEAWQAFCSKLHTFDMLESLVIKNLSLDGKKIDDLLQNLHPQHLKQLTIKSGNYVGLSPAEWEAVGSRLSTFRGLESMTLKNMNLDGTQINHLLQNIYPQGLRQLTLKSGNYFEPSLEEWQAFCRKLNGLKLLASLTINGFIIDGNKIDDFLDCLPPQIKQLRVNQRTLINHNAALDIRDVLMSSWLRNRTHQCSLNLNEAHEAGDVSSNLDDPAKINTSL